MAPNVVIAPTIGFVCGAAAGCFSQFVILHAGGWQWGLDLPPGDPLQRSAVTGFLSLVIVCQVADVIIRRTRRRKPFAAGLLPNRLVLPGIATELPMPAAVARVPVFNILFGTAPPEPRQPTLSVPFASAVPAGDGLRRVLVRARNQLVPPDLDHERDVAMHLAGCNRGIRNQRIEIMKESVKDPS